VQTPEENHATGNAISENYMVAAKESGNNIKTVATHQPPR